MFLSLSLSLSLSICICICVRGANFFLQRVCVCVIETKCLKGAKPLLSTKGSFFPVTRIYNNAHLRHAQCVHIYDTHTVRTHLRHAQCERDSVASVLYDPLRFFFLDIDMRWSCVPTRVYVFGWMIFLKTCVSFVRSMRMPVDLLWWARSIQHLNESLLSTSSC
jgi:hypothetical protein